MKIAFSKKRYLISFVYLWIFVGAFSFVHAKQISIVFRFDDPSALSSLDIELKVIKSFREHNASLTFGVIPFKCEKSTRDPSPQNLIPFGEEKRDKLRSAVRDGIVDIALHGYSHQMTAKNSWTEFSGVSYEKQYKNLSKGKQYIEKLFGKPIKTFIPPYNTYDLNTLKALEVLGFTTLSAGLHGEVSVKSGLQFIPMSIRLHQVKHAVEQARKSKDLKPIIVVMFHEYDFLDEKIDGIDKRLITIEDLNQLLSWLSLEDDVQIINFQQVTQQIDDLDVKRLSYVQYYESLKSLIPGFLKQSMSVYPERASLFGILTKTLIIYILIIVGTALLAWKIGCRIIFRFKNSKYFIIIPIGILLISFIVHLWTDMQIQARMLAFYLILVGYILGVSICLIRKLK